MLRQKDHLNQMPIATNSEKLDISLEDRTSELAKKISISLNKADVVLFHGEIGVGKTTFIKHLINNLQKLNNINQTEITSPTFNLVNEYMDFLVFNPDTVWGENYKKDIEGMEKLYFLNKVKNILLLVNKNFSFDKNLSGDFSLNNNVIKKDKLNNLIYTGCQIINKDLFKSYSVHNFSISEIWNNLIENNSLYGFESLENFYHLTNLEVYENLLKN